MAQRKKLFGTSGVRGKTNFEITPVLAMELAQSYGAHVGAGKKAAVGRDTRYGAEMIKDAIMAGLASVGIEAHDCGVLPTPGLGTWLRDGGFDAGFMVTGSHLPPDGIGIIAMLGDGAYIPDDMARTVEDIYYDRMFESHSAPPEMIPNSIVADGALEHYKESLLSLADTGAFALRKFKVVIDPVNGTGCGVLASVLKELGCEVVEIHDTPCGEQPRPSEPRASTLQKLSMTVLDEGADLGVGLDVDADRVIFIDEGGQAVSEDTAGMILADHVFREEKGPMVVPINSSGLVNWYANERDIELKFCKVGQPATVQAIKEMGAWYSYEESGKYYFAKEVNWCDGLLATIKMLEFIALDGESLISISTRYPHFFQVKQRIPLDGIDAEKLMDVVKHRFEPPGFNLLMDLDGLKYLYGDNSWLLIRPSGTEPLLRVYSDSPDRAHARELVAQGKEFVLQFIEEMRGDGND